MSRARTLVATELLLIAGLLAFIGAAWAAERILGLGAPVRLGPALSLALSAVPALLWLGYFYLQDRSEPEPKHYVLGVWLLGAFVAAPVARFLGNDALAQELAKYLVVRYSIYLSDEFDEPMDGIIYMTAAGIGFATAENVRHLQGVDGTVFLSTGAMTAVITTLAHGCFAGFLGWALGRARFARISALGRNAFLLAGLLMATALNAIFTMIQRAAAAGAGAQARPWRGVVFAAAFAAVVFAAVWFLARLPQAPGTPRRAA